MIPMAAHIHRYYVTNHSWLVLHLRHKFYIKQYQELA